VAVISDVAFIGNSVSGPVDWRPYLLGLAGGGALFVFGSDASGGALVQVVGCTFVNNTANATDLYPSASDSSGQGSLTKGAQLPAVAGSVGSCACACHCVAVPVFD
jgi:hypothetical protein